MKRSTVVWGLLAVVMLGLILWVSRSKTAAPAEPNILTQAAATEAVLSNGLATVDAVAEQLAAAVPTNVVTTITTNKTFVPGFTGFKVK